MRSGPCGADQSHTTHTTSSSEIQPADKCSLFEEARNTKLPVLSAEGVVHAWVGQIVTFFAYRPLVLLINKSMDLGASVL